MSQPYDPNQPAGGSTPLGQPGGDQGRPEFGQPTNGTPHPGYGAPGPTGQPYAHPYAQPAPGGQPMPGHPQFGAPQPEFVSEQPNWSDPAIGASQYAEPQPDVRPLSSVGDIVGNITRDVSTLIRQETELAKAELKDSASRAGKGAGMLAGAGVAGHMTLLFASLLLWWLLAEAFDSFGWAFFTVTLLWGIIAAVLALTGRKQLNQIKGLPQTTETVKEIPDALKGNEETR